ncbi:MAG: hypothetical protein ACYDEH_09505 [Acidimicrobiales bacterium]
MCNKVVHSGRRCASATLRRAAIVAVAGLFPLAVVLSTASAASATTGSVAFNGAMGSNGSYAATVTFSATSSDNTYTAVAYDTANSTATFTYATTSGSAGCAVVSPNSGAVTFTSPGTCVITATTTSTDKDQGQGSGDGNATGATGTLTLTVLPTPQTITFTNTPPSTPLVGSTYTVSATASSGLAVQLTVDRTSTSGCTLSVSTSAENQSSLVTTGVVTLSPPVGTCVIDANQAGSADYAPAPPKQQAVTDALAAQTINVAGPNPASVQYSATSTYQIQATDSSAVTIDYTTSSSTCAVNATGLISDLGIGTCVVTLSAPGTSSVSAASPVTFTLSVQSPPPPQPPPVVVVVTPPVVTPPPPQPVVTPPVVTPPPPVVIRVSPSKPVHKPKPRLPRPKNVVIKPFAEASNRLTKPLLAQVWRLALSIKRQHYTAVTLTGYTDNVFTPAMDALVIRERSLAVRRQLQFDLGRLKMRRVTITIAPGITIQLVTLNTTPLSRALNRRVVATLTA